MGALVLATPTVQALTPEQTKAKIASLKKQLNALPKHKGIFSRVNSVTVQLVTLDPKKASAYLATALPKIGLTNALNNAKALTTRVNAKVKGAKILSAPQKKTIIAKNNALLKKYVPPRPPPGPYQSSRTVRPAWIG